MLDRRRLILGSAALTVAACGPQAADANTGRFAADPFRRISDAEWRRRLGDPAWRVLRHEATERPYSSPLNDESRRGVYACRGCELPLFRSDWKYDSSTGWPSFWRVMEANIGTKIDYLIGIPRREYHCARCLGHQGHVFNDGPRPTGLRYCNNGLALTFRPGAA